MTGKKKYSIVKGCAYTAHGGVVNDSIGRVFYAMKANPEIQLGEMSSFQTAELITPATTKTINNSLLKSNTIDCFYKILSSISIYSQNVKVGNSTTTRKLTQPTISVTKIQLASGIATLEIRNNDPWILPHADVPPFDLFSSIAITSDQVTAIIPQLASLDNSAKNLLVNNVTPVKTTGYRNYYHGTLTILGSQPSAGKAMPQSVQTGINLYSLDNSTWMSTEYASAAFNLIQGTRWDNQVIPNPIDTNPFGANWAPLLNNLQSILSDANNLPSANDNHGNRLLNQPIRDYLYAGDLNNVTFQMAFRLPFFLESTTDVPYTVLESGRFNNPYYTKFDSWFAYANVLRTSGNLSLLTESGKLTTEYSSTYFDYNEPYQNLLTVTTSLVKYFFDNKVPAYIAKNFDFENGGGYSAIADVPAPQGSVVKKGQARNLDDLVNSGMIDEDKKNGLVNGTLKYVTFPDGTYSGEQITNGFVTRQKNVKTKQYEYFVKTYSWNQKSGTTPNSSGLTFGFGFDVGGKQAQDLADYVGTTIPTSGLIHDAVMGAVQHKRLDALKNYFTYYDSVWKTTQFQVPFQRAVLKTIPLMKSQQYLGGGVNAAAKTFIKSGQKTGSLLLRTFEPSFGYFFNEGNIHQYLNEFEKVYFLSLVWNKGTGSLMPYLKGTPRKVVLSQIAKRAIHAFNVHDMRYHQYSLAHSQISHQQKIANILNSITVNNYFLNL